MSKKKLTVSLSEELYSELTKRAERRGITLTDLVRGALRLDFYVDDHDASLMVREGEEVKEVLLVG